MSYAEIAEEMTRLRFTDSGVWKNFATCQDSLEMMIGLDE